MKYTFSNRTEITGTLENIYLIAKALGESVDITKVEGFTEDTIPAGYYLSEKSGLVELKTMNSFHLRNALKKRAIVYLTNLGKSKIETDTEYLDKFAKLTEDRTIVDLFSELYTR